MSGPVGEHPAGATLRLRVVPRSSRTQLSGRFGDALKVKVQAPPEAGAANEAVLALLADQLHLDSWALGIVAGATSRDKVVLVRGITPDGLRGRLVEALDER